MHIGVRTIDREAVGVISFFGVHEDTIGDMTVVEVGGIDTTLVGTIVESTMVDEGRAGNSVQRTTAIEVDKTAGTVSTAVEGTVGDGDVTELVGHVSGVYRTGGVGCASEEEETVVDGDIKECVAGNETQYIGSTLDG